MGLVLYLVAAWAIVMVFLSLKNRLPNKLNINLYLIIQIININFFTIFSLDLKYFTLSKEPVAVLTMIVFRNLIFPFLFLIYINELFNLQKFNRRLFLTVSIFSCLLTTEYGFRIFGYKQDRHWSIYHFSFFILFMMLVTIVAAILLRKLANKEKFRL